MSIVSHSRPAPGPREAPNGAQEAPDSAGDSQERALRIGVVYRSRHGRGGGLHPGRRQGAKAPDGRGAREGRRPRGRRAAVSDARRAIARHRCGHRAHRRLRDRSRRRHARRRRHHRDGRPRRAVGLRAGGRLAISQRGRRRVPPRYRARARQQRARGERAAGAPARRPTPHHAAPLGASPRPARECARDAQTVQSAGLHRRDPVPWRVQCSSG